MRYDLSQCRWQLKGYYPWVPLKDTSMETGKELMGITDWIDAQVPGGVHLDLLRAGLIPHPYPDLNSLCCEWVENRWWLYRTYLNAASLPAGERQLLVFEGLDYDASIYLCGRLLCRHQGMYERIELNITELVASARQPMELKVLFRHAPDEMGQIGMTSRTFTQKSRFNYKWDFSTRLVNLGIWEKCYVETVQQGRITEPCLYSAIEDGEGIIFLSARLDATHPLGDFSASCTVEGQGAAIKAPVQLCGDTLTCRISIHNPLLWYPNGYGSQPLYQVTLRLYCQGQCCDTLSRSIGIRSLKYRQNEGSPADALPYTFVINGLPIYIKGVNMTPLDHLYGAVSEEHYEQMVLSMRHMNVNMVRVWGGGIIEKECFYDLCDRYGILIWQEFIQSSSGIDNIPSKRPEFLELLERTAVNAVTCRRSHTALTVWSGGNELNDEHFHPAGYSDANLSMLQGIVQRLDPQRLFLPTSASGPREFISYEQGVSHDIHGHWNYCGNPEHYRLYGQSDSLFHSEFGTDGMCSPRSLNKFLSARYQTLEPAEDNICYRHHGEWWCTFRRDTEIFGPRCSIEELSACSQWMQAEGLRYILESNRRRKFKNSGSIIWQINEPWPNVSCTSLLDYYMEPKMAYYWCQNAFADFAVSLQYSKLDWKSGETLTGTVFLHHDTEPRQQACTISAELFDETGRLLSTQSHGAQLASQHAVQAAGIALPVPDGYTGLLILRLRAMSGEEQAENCYFFGCNCTEVYRTALAMPAAAPTVLSSVPVGSQQLLCTVANLTSVPSLHIHPVDRNDSVHLLADAAYFTLMPGEQRTIRLDFTQKFSSGFLPDPPRPAASPDIAWLAFNR